MSQTQYNDQTVLY